MTFPIQTIHRILLPVERAASAQTAIDFAVVLATALGASITFAHVDVIPNAMIGIVPGVTVDGELAAARIASRLALQRIVSDLAARGFTGATTMVIESSDVAGSIVDAARSGRHDLIVMGTHARTGVSRLVLGSVAEEVLRRAPCPVVTVHLPPAA